MSHLSVHYVLFHHPYSASVQCHLITNGFMCLRPPEGAEIVLFLSEVPLIFYYTIKLKRSSHKQLEIKCMPFEGFVHMHLCVCLKRAVVRRWGWGVGQGLCVFFSELSTCQQILRTGWLRFVQQLFS